MVIVRLVGGLGNQMFQYAAGRAVAHRNQTQLKLDVSALERDARRNYKLHHFNIQERFASPEELARVKGTSGNRLTRLVLLFSRGLLPRYRWTVIQEDYIGPFDPSIMAASGNVYLAGYWQSEKYFTNIQDIIRHEFTVKYAPDAQSRAVAEMIDRIPCSVSLHVRRGDYVSSPRTARVHGTCDLTYYQEAVKWIAERVPQPHLFVFSDDPGWITENLHVSYPTTLVTHNDATRDYEDLRLMSLCKHHIIANSTFSWWGAWLCPNPGKLVVAPRRWFNEFEADTRDLIPDCWYRL